MRVHLRFAAAGRTPVYEQSGAEPRGGASPAAGGAIFYLRPFGTTGDLSAAEKRCSTHPRYAAFGLLPAAAGRSTEALTGTCLWGRQSLFGKNRYAHARLRTAGARGGHPGQAALSCFVPSLIKGLHQCDWKRDAVNPRIIDGISANDPFCRAGTTERR